jgi:hypothetical protein
VLKRLAADFYEQDLYMSFEALDLHKWQTVLAATQDEKVRCSIPLLRKARRLCDSLGVAWNPEKFAQVVKKAVQFRRQRLPQGDVDNRNAWAHLLATSFEHAWMLPVVQFYVSHPDGTGDVERGLGEHARFHDSHRGAPEGQALSATEMCPEIRKEGPQTAAELFTQTEAGDLQLTDFSRQLAQLWLDTHGRRFACQKQCGMWVGFAQVGD